MSKTTPLNNNALVIHGSVIGCPNWLFADVYVKCGSMGKAMDWYHTLTCIEGVWYGKLTTRRCQEKNLPKKIGPERSAAVHHHYDRLKRAERLILRKAGIPFTEPQ